MNQVKWTPIAESDLDDILFYIAQKDQRQETAVNIYYELQEAIEKRVLNDVPGQRHAATPSSWLFFSFKRWLVFYQPLADGIEIMRVIDGVRDLPKVF